MSRRRATALVVGLTAALLAACGGSGGSGGPAGSGGGEGAIKLGAWYPLTGPQASSGVPQHEGAKAFFDQFNAKGGLNGKKVEFITKDNAFDPQQTIQVARELVTKDKVQAIVATNGTATTEATFPFVLQQNKVPIFGTYGGSQAWYTPPRDGLFGTQALYEDQAKVAIDWAIESGVKNILVVRDDPEAFANVARVAMNQAKAQGATADEVVVKIGTTDYAPIVSQVKSKAPGGVFLVLPPQEAAAYFKEADLQQFHLPVYGYAPAATEATLDLAGKSAEGFRAVSLTLPPSAQGTAMDEYREAMKTYRGGHVDLYSLSAYASAKAFMQIVSGIKGDITKESITKAILAASKVDTGIAPPMSFGAQKHLGTQEVARVEVKDGKYVEVGDFVSPKQVG